MPVYVLPEFLSPEECETATSSCTPTATALLNNSAARVRKSKTAFLSSATNEKQQLLIEKISSIVSKVNDRIFHFELSGIEPVQLAKYDEGDQYGWHLDIGPGIAECRKLSASVQLSDPANYDGGRLEVWGSPEVPRAAYERGAIVIFPAYLLHRVTPVTRGSRLSLVVWSRGDKAFR